MRVGVFVSDVQKNDGGSYTFQTDIFAALQVLSPKTSHTFVILGNLKSSSELEHIPYRLDLWEKIIKRSLSWSPLFYQIWKRISTLEKLIKIHHIDLLWFINPDFIPANLPYIVSIWDLQHRLQPWFPEVSHNGVWDLRERDRTKMLRSASIVITGTEVGKQEVEYFYQVPPDNIKVVPFATPSFALNSSAVNLDNSELDSRDSQVPIFPNIFPSLEGVNLKNFLFYPAQFWAHKNHVALLLAIKNLGDRHNLNFPLVFVGSDKGNQKYVEQVVASLNLKQVYFLGFVTQAQLIWLYRHAFALIFPTFFGPDNLPPLEAFGLGCPVIASKVAGAEEQLGNAALLFDPKQPEELEIAIKSLWENPELRQNLIKLGLARAKQWTSTNYVESVFQILDDFAPIRQCWQNSQNWHNL